MHLRIQSSALVCVQGRMKLARLLEMTEHDLEKRIQEIESSSIFIRLKTAGAITIHPYPQTKFVRRWFAGWSLRAPSEGLPDLLHGERDIAKLMRRLGQEKFERYFLGEEKISDNERAQACGLSHEDVRKLREFINRLYIQNEFEGPAHRPAPQNIYSSIAGIEIENGQPIISFFNKEIWKGRYSIHPQRSAQMIKSLPLHEARKAEKLLRELALLDQRKTALYRILEILIKEQQEYLISGDPARRRPLTQRAVASKLDIEFSALNRLISNKAVQLPWRLECPLKSLFPSRKSLLLEQLYKLAKEHPELSDEKLREILQRQCAVKLSRRSIAQYRKDLNLGPIKRR